VHGRPACAIIAAVDGDLKRCPDCAEQVQGQARVCRFCGFRFGAGSVGPFDFLRRPRSTVPLPSLLAEWGSALAQGEDVAFFAYCRLGADDGYLLVTTARIAFFGSRGAARLLDWTLAELRGVEQIGRPWRGRGIELRGPDRRVSLRRFGSRRQRERLAAVLSPPTC